MKSANTALRRLLLLCLLPCLLTAAPVVAQTVTAWGWNGSGQTTIPGGLDNAVAVAAGLNHSLAVRANGTVAAWGANSQGQTTVPAGLSNVVSVAAGDYHSLALKADGTVVAWGSNDYGQATVPAGLANVIAVAAGNYYSVALMDGMVVVWGAQSEPAGLANVVAVAAGGVSHVLALKADGTVTAWGGNAYGAASIPPGLTNVAAVAAGWFHSLALKADGTVTAWGRNDYGQASVPPGLTNVVAVAAGGNYSAALKTDGTIAVWGGYLLNSAPGGVSNGVALAVGGDHLLALSGSAAAPFALTSGRRALALWDTPFHYQIRTTRLPVTALTVSGLPAGLTFDPGSGVISGTPSGFGEFIVQIAPAAGGGQASLLLSVLRPPVIGPAPRGLWLAHNPVPPAVQFRASGVPGSFSATGLPPGTSMEAATGRILGAPTATGLYAVTITCTNQFGSATLSTTVEVTPVAAWGENNKGQSTVPAGLFNVVAVAAGEFHSLALKADGTVAAWGSNDFGQITVPAGLTNVVAVSAGWGHSLALKADGTVVAWGINQYDQSTVPAGLDNVVAVAAGGLYHSLALKAHGTVSAWGYDSNGFSLMPVTVPAGLDNVVAVAAGDAHSLALKSDGTVAAWGNNSRGQTTVPAGLANAVAVAAGGGHSLAVKTDGSVVAWGSNTYGQTTVPAGLSNVIAVTAGEQNSLALKADGTMTAWGDNTNNYIPAGLASVVSVTRKGRRSMVLTGPLTPASLQLFVPSGQPFSSSGPGAKAGCTWRVLNQPAWLTVNPLTGALTGTAPAGFTGQVTRELRYRAGYTVEAQNILLRTPPYATYAAWQSACFGSTSTPQSQPAADADGDGMANTLEFLTGGNPKAADAGAFAFQITGNTLACTLDVLPGLESAATLRAQFSSDLAFLSPAEATTPSRTETLPGGLRRLVFEDRVSTPGMRRFARLVSSLP